MRLSGKLTVNKKGFDSQSIHDYRQTVSPTLGETGEILVHITVVNSMCTFRG